MNDSYKRFGWGPGFFRHKKDKNVYRYAVRGEKEKYAEIEL